MAAVSSTSTTAVAIPAAVPASASTAVVVSTSAATATVAASAPVAAIKKPAVMAPPSVPEPSFFDSLTSNDFFLPGAIAALLALIGGVGFYKYKKRSQATQVDSSFLESRLQPDSFFGASGGQRIDTSESGNATGSSLVYSPSQLDAAGDVDPVAEADVYLAYGRDLQAEEILKEAMRTNPMRVAIHAKLMEIYAKRRDIKGFEVVAIEAFNLTRGEGSEWAYIAEMGRELEPGNPLYQPGGHPKAAGTSASLADEPTSSLGFGSSTISQTITPHLEEPSGQVDFDLDLDFSAGDLPVASAPAPHPSHLATMPVEQSTSSGSGALHDTQALAASTSADLNFNALDLDVFSATSKPVSSAKPEVLTPAATSDGSLNFVIDEPLTSTPMAAATSTQLPSETLDHGMLEFDLSSLSLDLSPTTESPSLSTSDAGPSTGSPLETKFALAEEFRALGDPDAARSLAEEVAAQAQGPLKNKAQAFLKALL